MKHRISYIMSIAIICSIVACSKGSNDEEGTIKQNISMAAEASSILVNIDRMNEPIVHVRSGENWLTASAIPYTSGAAMVKLEAKSNPETNERQTIVYVQAESGKKAELKVVQKAKAPSSPEGTTVEDSHDRVTDQPAYTPKR